MSDDFSPETAVSTGVRLTDLQVGPSPKEQWDDAQKVSRESLSAAGELMRKTRTISAEGERIPFRVQEGKVDYDAGMKAIIWDTESGVAYAMPGIVAPQSVERNGKPGLFNKVEPGKKLKEEEAFQEATTWLRTGITNIARGGSVSISGPVTEGEVEQISDLPDVEAKAAVEIARALENMPTSKVSSLGTKDGSNRRVVTGISHYEESLESVTLVAEKQTHKGAGQVYETLNIHWVPTASLSKTPIS